MYFSWWLVMLLSLHAISAHSEPDLPHITVVLEISARMGFCSSSLLKKYFKMSVLIEFAL